MRFRASARATPNNLNEVAKSVHQSPPRDRANINLHARLARRRLGDAVVCRYFVNFSLNIARIIDTLLIVVKLLHACRRTKGENLLAGWIAGLVGQVRGWRGGRAIEARRPGRGPQASRREAVADSRLRIQSLSSGSRDWSRTARIRWSSASTAG